MGLYRLLLGALHTNIGQSRALHAACLLTASYLTHIPPPSSRPPCVDIVHWVVLRATVGLLLVGFMVLTASTVSQKQFNSMVGHYLPIVVIIRQLVYSYMPDVCQISELSSSAFMHHPSMKLNMYSKNLSCSLRPTSMVCLPLQYGWGGVISFYSNSRNIN